MPGRIHHQHCHWCANLLSLFSKLHAGLSGSQRNVHLLQQGRRQAESRSRHDFPGGHVTLSHRGMSCIALRKCSIDRHANAPWQAVVHGLGIAMPGSVSRTDHSWSNLVSGRSMELLSSASPRTSAPDHALINRSIGLGPSAKQLSSRNAWTATEPSLKELTDDAHAAT